MKGQDAPVFASRRGEFTYRSKGITNAVQEISEDGQPFLWVALSMLLWAAAGILLMLGFFTILPGLEL